MLQTRTASGRAPTQDKDEAADDEFMPNWKAIVQGEGIITRTSTKPPTSPTIELEGKAGQSDAKATGKENARSSIKAAVEAAMRIKRHPAPSSSDKTAPETEIQASKELDARAQKKAASKRRRQAKKEVKREKWYEKHKGRMTWKQFDRLWRPTLDRIWYRRRPLDAFVEYQKRRERDREKNRLRRLEGPRLMLSPESALRKVSSRLTEIHRQLDYNIDAVNEEAAVLAEMPREMARCPEFWSLLRVFAPSQGVSADNTCGKPYHSGAIDDYAAYPPPYGIRPNDEDYHFELAKFEFTLMDRAKSEWALKHDTAPKSTVMGAISPSLPAFKHDLRPPEASPTLEDSDQGLITWPASPVPSSSPRRPPPPPPLRCPPPAPPKRPRSIRFADEVGGALEQRSHHPSLERQPGTEPGPTQTTSSLGVHVVEEAEPDQSRDIRRAKPERLQPPGLLASRASDPSGQLARQSEDVSPITVHPALRQAQFSSLLSLERRTASRSSGDSEIEDELLGLNSGDEYRDEDEATSGNDNRDEAQAEQEEIPKNEDEQKRKDSGCPQSPATQRESGL